MLLQRLYFLSRIEMRVLDNTASWWPKQDRWECSKDDNTNTCYNAARVQILTSNSATSVKIKYYNALLPIFIRSKWCSAIWSRFRHVVNMSQELNTFLNRHGLEFGHGQGKSEIFAGHFQHHIILQIWLVPVTWQTEPEPGVWNKLEPSKSLFFQRGFKS